MKREKDILSQEEEKEAQNAGTGKTVDIKKEIRGFIVYLAILLVIVFCVIHFVGQRTSVNGASMYPTLEDGDQLIVDKLTYRFKDPERFDIVVFPRELNGKSEFLIKRIIGLPGETVWIDEDGNIYIDGEILEEDYGLEPIDINHRYRAEDTITLGDDEYFVMGDNRNNSKDGRDPDVGNVSRDELEGRAWVRIFPFSKFGVLKHQ